MRLYLSHEANQRLESIERYIIEEQQTPIQAADVMMRLYDSLDHIAQNSLIGHRTDYPDNLRIRGAWFALHHYLPCIQL